MAEVSGGELQTLISTLQNGNVQLGHIFRQIGGLTPALSALTAQLSVIAQAALGPQMGEVETRTGGAGLAAALPDAPEGYITVDIPGVGPRLVPYYSGP
jgi:hypothetical protein